MYESRPWLRHYGDVPHSLDYPETTMYEAVMRTVAVCPDAPAWDFMGTVATYRELREQVDRCADALAGLGLRQGDAITISMPTSPPGVIAFYAANKLGAVASMIHPLSTRNEIEHYVRLSKSRFVLTLDLFHETLVEVQRATGFERLILVHPADGLPLALRALYWLKQGRKLRRPPYGRQVIAYDELLRRKHRRVARAAVDADAPAAILYSGGTTGTPKGILLSNRNFICEGMMCGRWVGLDRDHPGMLALLPLFHGFGLGICIHAVLMAGGTAILVPRFEPEKVGAIVRRKRPNYLVGPPTLFAALAESRSFRRADLSCLRATFSGADSLPRPVKERFEAVVREGGGNVRLLQGYGLTEAVTAIMASPLEGSHEDSIGLPFPDMLAKVVRRGSTEEAAAGEEGEICVSGPAVMLGYLEAPEENARVLQRHEDGRRWLHTGDLGSMDEDGFFYFKLRLKRMIKSSGMNVYPTQVEARILEHPAVREVCVIGVPDERQVERVRAVVVPTDPARAGEALEREIIEHCRETLIRWSCPREVEFRDALPRTRVGKIAYKQLEEDA